MSDDGTHCGTNRVTVLDRSRSLVFVERRSKPRNLVRAPSEFLTQLIACEQHLGHYRRARRVAPETGTLSYSPQQPMPAPRFVRSL